MDGALKHLSEEFDVHDFTESTDGVVAALRQLRDAFHKCALAIPPEWIARAEAKRDRRAHDHGPRIPLSIEHPEWFRLS